MERLEALKRGGKVALARALSMIEEDADGEAAAGLLDSAYRAPHGIVVGLTGPPGVGKSTLIDAVIREIRARGKTVGIIAVDPSSKLSRGSLLGDRTRLTVAPEDTGVFVRSMAARDQLGGVASITFPASVLMRALFDIVIIETVGIGQSETAISDQADVVIFCAQPGSGDALQFMKAGIMELPDLFVVTKADLEALARRTETDLRGALSLMAGGETPAEVLRCSAARGEGISEVVDWISACADTGLAADAGRRADQVQGWAEDQLTDRFGREGLELLHSRLESPLEAGPFSNLTTITKEFRRKFLADS